MILTDIPCCSHEYVRKTFAMHDLLTRAKGPDRASWADLPNDPGIYVVSWPIGEAVEFLETPGGATFATRADPAHLRRKWEDIQKVKPTDLIYFGKADKIRQRIRQLARFGVGRARNHVGGEWLWQIAGIENTSLLIQVCPMGRQLGFENWLLEAFFGEHGNYPFANREGPQGADRWRP